MDELDKIITKSQIIDGIEYRENVKTEMGTFSIRSLKEGERARSSTMIVRGITTKVKPHDIKNMEIEGAGDKIMQNSVDKDHFIIACGLSSKDEKWTMDDVKDITFKGDSMGVLLDAIKKLSGMEGEAVAKAQSFSKDD